MLCIVLTVGCCLFISGDAATVVDRVRLSVSSGSAWWHAGRITKALITVSVGFYTPARQHSAVHSVASASGKVELLMREQIQRAACIQRRDDVDVRCTDITKLPRY